MISDLVARSAQHPEMVQAVAQAVTNAVHANLGRVMHQVLREAYPGETIALYVPKLNKPSQANAAMLQDLRSGLTPQQVATRHGKSLRQVYRVQALSRTG